MRLILVVLYLIGSFTIVNAQESNILNDTLVFYYKTDAYTLSSNQETELRNFFINKELLKISVEGFTDYVGSERNNHILAFKRAEYVSDLIINEQFIDSIEVSSKGEQPKPEDHNEYQGNATDRKVICYVTYENNLLENDTSLLDSSDNYLDTINQLEVGERLVLRNILFYLGIAVIIPSSYSELVRLRDILNRNPNLVIEIRGHVCCGVIPEVSEDMPIPEQSDSNLVLSRNRAFAVKSYLMKHGIDDQRIRIKGMGFLEPLYYPEKNDKERQFNRRIELIILEK